MGFRPRAERSAVLAGALGGLSLFLFGNEAVGGRLWVLFPLLTLLFAMAAGFLGLSHLITAAPGLGLGPPPKAVAPAIRWCGAASLYNALATAFIGSVRQGLLGEGMVAFWAAVSITALLVVVRAVRALHLKTASAREPKTLTESE